MVYRVLVPQSKALTNQDSKMLRDVYSKKVYRDAGLMMGAVNPVLGTHIFQKLAMTTKQWTSRNDKVKAKVNKAFERIEWDCDFLLRRKRERAEGERVGGLPLETEKSSSRGIVPLPLFPCSNR